jgi:hypothetical protein
MRNLTPMSDLNFDASRLEKKRSKKIWPKKKWPSPYTYPIKIFWNFLGFLTSLDRSRKTDIQTPKHDVKVLD